MSDKLLEILLVEDNKGDAVMLQGMLEPREIGNFNISVVETLQEAKDYVKSKHVDVILLDLTLPDSSGLETVTRFREACPDKPIVVLTGVDDEKIGIEAIRLGVQDYLIKGQAYGRTIARVIYYSLERKLIEEKLRHNS